MPSPPTPLTDRPEDLTRRNQAAIAAIAALRPANAPEADQAALYVAAFEQSMECLHLAKQPEATFDQAQKCRAQANSMMRQSQGALRLLLRLQAARQSTEADNEARDKAAQTEQRAINLMTEALAPQPAGHAPSPCGRGLGEGAVPAKLDTPKPDTAVPPERAALITRMGRIPNAPGDHRVRARTTTSLTPAFTTLDQQFAEAPAA